jgi:4-diphosphocytidyl-2-C-methyl-D-erythritol kinase
MQAEAPAKINAFLKITGKRGNYHEIISRFIKIPTLHDTLSFEPQKKKKVFTLEGDFGCQTEQNTIYKVYQKLLDISDKDKIENFFKVHKVVVDKKIPSFAGLGGGSSDAATFLHMCNDYIELGLEHESLATLGATVGADIPFFVYDFNAANVSGIGEIVAPFEDEHLDFELFTPNIACDTVDVYKNYSQKFYAPISSQDKRFFATLKTKDALNLYTIDTANDLYSAAKDLYPKLAAHEQEGRFFSGSGSTFFSLKGI